MDSECKEWVSLNMGGLSLAIYNAEIISMYNDLAQEPLPCWESTHCDSEKIMAPETQCGI